MEDYTDELLKVIGKGTRNESKESLQVIENRELDLKLGPPGLGSQGAATTISQPNSFKKRVEERPVMGWPPVGSYRKVVARSSSFAKVATTKYSNIHASSENSTDGLFVKVNMDGVPIGRKLDLRAYDNYQCLYSGVHELFRGLLAAQRDTPFVGLTDKTTEESTESKEEYALVYEDDEGDRVLVGDTPWDMFVSSAKRLRLLKRSEVAETT